MKHLSFFVHGWQIIGCALLMMLATALNARAQVPDWQAAVAIGGGTTVTATTTDTSGNVYLAGNFSGTVSVGNTTFSAAGGQDVFVAKWNSVTNSIVWAQRAGSTSDDHAFALAVSGTSVYVAGDFLGTATFGSTQVVSRGDIDGFVAKLTDGGTSATWNWALMLGGTASDQAYALAANGPNVYVGGVFNSSTALFGSSTVTNASTNGSTADGFVAHLTDTGSAGAVTWVQPVSGSGSDFVTSLVVAGNAVIVGGQFSNTLAFGSTVLVGGSLTGFVGKLLDTGSTSQYAWAVRTNGIAVIINAVAVDGASVYVTGRFLFNAAFGSYSFTSAGTMGGYDVFVAKITDAGTSAAFTWAVRAGGVASDYANAIAASGGNVYVTGGFSGTSSFGGTSLTGAGLVDNIFLAKLTDVGGTGSFDWAIAAGGGNSQQALGVAIGTGGRVYVSGGAVPGVIFGRIRVLGVGNGGVGFLASLTDATLTATSMAAAAEQPIVFPNPAHSRVTVQIPAVFGTVTATLTVLDALGRTLRTQVAATNSKVELDLTGLAPGRYAVRVAAGGSAATRWLVVE
ncbi:T9SS type A sorting domain-containing protein [Hymenobacter terricola]|uniref:T9SS type A sorting domain-containing protein n=1 Tax=Hymenobacter terricola TaxID=2819236 RepID=UPI001B30869F|nr:T9SS type A sorting domain-containing protein [Hymenobacter terricola]